MKDIYYIRIVKNGEELIRTNDYENLNKLVNDLNYLINALELDSELEFKVFKDHYEIGYMQLAPYGLMFVDNKEGE